MAPNWWRRCWRGSMGSWRRSPPGTTASTMQVKALNARIAELEAKRGGPPKTPDNSSPPPSRGQKANTEPPAVKRRRKGRPGVARKLAENPDATRRFFAEHSACGAVLSEAGQELAKQYDHIDIPPIRPITTRVELFRATCPCCKARVTASAPADMPEGTPFGPGGRSVAITSTSATAPPTSS
jgi:transposase